MAQISSAGLWQAHLCLLEHTQLLHLGHIHQAGIAAWPVLEYACIRECILATNHPRPCMVCLSSQTLLPGDELVSDESSS